MAASAAPFSPFSLQGRRVTVAGPPSERQTLVRQVLTHFGATVDDASPEVAILVGARASDVTGIPAGCAVVSEGWLHSSVKAGAELDAATFAAAPSPGKRLAPPPSVAAGFSFPGLPGTAPATPPSALAGLSAPLQAGCNALAGCVVATAGFSPHTVPTADEVAAALAYGGACVLDIAYADALTHLVAYVPCPAVAVGSDGRVSHVLPAGRPAPAAGIVPATQHMTCVAAELRGGGGMVVPVAEVGAPGAPPQQADALAEAVAAETAARELTAQHAGAADLLAITPTEAPRDAEAPPLDVDAVRGAAGTAPPLPGSQQRLGEGGRFVVDVLSGAWPAGTVDTAPPQAAKWVWRRTFSGCGRAHLAAAAGAWVVSAGWVLQSLQAGRPGTAGPHILAPPGTPAPCLHTRITPWDVEAALSKAGGPGADSMAGVRGAIRAANAATPPSPWPRILSAVLGGASGKALPPWAELRRRPVAQDGPLVMLTGRKGAADVPQRPSGTASPLAVSASAVAAAVSEVLGGRVLAAAEQLAAPASDGRHAHDARVDTLVTWSLSRVEKLCAVMARGGWVLWPSVVGSAPGALEAAEVSPATSAPQQPGARVWAGAPRAWRLARRPAFAGWVALLLDVPVGREDGPPADTLHRVLAAGGAAVTRLQPGGDGAFTLPPLPPPPPPTPAAADVRDGAWPPGRTLPPLLLLLVPGGWVRPGAGVPDAAGELFLAAQAAASGAGWVPSAVRLAPRAWVLDYLTRQALPPLPEVGEASESADAAL